MKRLYRSHSNRVIAGVCGGLGYYFSIDPVLIRLVWLLLILFGGVGLLLYLIAWLIIPMEPEAEEAERAAAPPTAISKGRFWWGLALIAMGVVLYSSQFRFIYWPMIPGVRLHSRDFVPFALVLVGIYLLYTFARVASGKVVSGERRLYRSREDKKIGGVCGGIADYFQIDSTLVRVLFVAGSFFYLAGVLIYLVLLVALPEEPFETATEAEQAPAKKADTASKRGKGTKGDTEKA
ncbi:MAG: PspC domain-containing protein [Candidatus Neomarinimicrobiota bacterium]